MYIVACRCVLDYTNVLIKTTITKHAVKNAHVR